MVNIELEKISSYQELKTLIDEVSEHIFSFYGRNNKTAGTKVRKAMQNIKAKANDIRREVQEIKQLEAKLKKDKVKTRELEKQT